MSKKVKIAVWSVAGLLCAAVVISAIVLSCVFYAPKDAFEAGWNTNPASSREGVADMLEAVPSAKQLAHSQLGYYAFFHFGTNTFTDLEWGDGKADPSVFNPSELNTDQWVETVKNSGAKAAIITAKHHDGFCLWPSAYTDYDVASSPYKGGSGDIVKEFADSCKKFGIKFGVYLSPWDRHEPTYGSGTAYDDFYVNQLKELLTNYGDVFEVWFDGAPSDEDRENLGSPKQDYDWERYFNTVNELQPAACTAICGTDIRWVGNENGLASENEWSVVANGDENGQPNGTYRWYPAECDVSIRDGWFWHENQKPKSLSQLLKIYYSSVGRNASLLLNIPPDRRGLIDDKDVERLAEFGEAIEKIYKNPVKTGMKFGGADLGDATPYVFDNAAASDDAASYRLADDEFIMDIKLEKKTHVKHIVLKEDITQSQRVEGFVVYAKSGGKYIRVYEGEVIGAQTVIKLDGFLTPKTDNFRIVFTQSRSNPVISFAGFFE